MNLLNESVERALKRLPPRLTLDSLCHTLGTWLTEHEPSCLCEDCDEWEAWDNPPTRWASAMIHRTVGRDQDISVWHHGSLDDPKVLEATVHELAHIALDMGKECDCYQWAVEVAQRLPDRVGDVLRKGIVNILLDIGIDIDAHLDEHIVDFMRGEGDLPWSWTRHVQTSET